MGFIEHSNKWFTYSVKSTKIGITQFTMNPQYVHKAIKIQVKLLQTENTKQTMLIPATQISYKLE